MSHQPEFDFGNRGQASGLERWLEERRAAQLELARRLGLPLGHTVEVWLTSGIRLTGELRLAEEQLFVENEAPRALRLVVDGVDFEPDQIESCIRQG